MLPPVAIPLNAEQMEVRLDHFLDSVLSSRRTAGGVAQKLAHCSRDQQEYVLRWVDVMARSNGEIAYQFANQAAQALALMDEDSIEAWIIQAMDVYDRTGLHAAIRVIDQVDAYAAQRVRRSRGLPLDAVLGVLETFIAGLSGRRLRLAADAQTFTDTETLFLPELIGHASQREANFLLYKAMAVHLWAQTRFGTWRLNVRENLAVYPDPARACELFHSLERLRLDACVARELPGLHRALGGLLRELGESAIAPGWADWARILGCSGATVTDTYALLPSVYASGIAPAACCYQGVLLPALVESALARRLAHERDLFRLGLVQLAQESDRQPLEAADQDPLPRFRLAQTPDENPLEPADFQLYLDGVPVVPPDTLRGLMDSIIQDLGQIPEEYLVPAGAGGYQIQHPGQREADSELARVVAAGALLYNEWDCDRQHYRKNWCVLREQSVILGSESFVYQTLHKYRGQLGQLRRLFEALRGEQKWLHAQAVGEDIDLDACVRAYADARHGLEMTGRLYTRLDRHERNIAVMFMVDMSGSTKGWINEAERESLVLLCEALESLGDRYAIYGFSGMTRLRCEIYHIKRFDEAYTSTVRQRISGITPQDYTRMGTAIRHLSGLLNAVEARTKLLITLSDGRPDDYGDNYRGRYGIEDTRQALLEAKRHGIHSFCITLDTEARDYLSHMYGQVNYVVIDEVRKLPLKVADIYRRLTT